MNRVEGAVLCFEQGFSCSQALLSTYGPELGLDREIALKVATAFGGGMGGMGETCGAVTGAFMVIGLKYGRTRDEDGDAAEKAYNVVREFVDKSKSRHGSIVCRELLDYDISSPQRMQAATEEGLFTIRCPRFVRDAAEIVELLLGEEGLDVQGQR
jgi:C_GCAxxG_C_C family probable redox protein